MADDHAAVLNTYHIEPTLEGVTAYLESLKSLETRRAWQDQLVAKLIIQFNDSDWSVRDRATRMLATLSVRARPALTRALQHDDLETVWRARQLLNSTERRQYEKADNQGMLITAVCHAIERKPIKGAAPVLIDLIKHIREKYVLSSVRATLVATVTRDDADLLGKAIASEDAETKIAAITALGRASVQADELRSLIKDIDPLVKTAAAHALALRGDRTSLPVLVELLSTDNVRVRSEAVRILRATTGQRLGFAAFDDRDNQKGNVQKWRHWIRSNAANAELTHPFALETDDFETFYNTVRVYCTSGNGHLQIMIAGKIVMSRGTGVPYSVGRGTSMIAVHQGKLLMGQSFDTWGDSRASAAFANTINNLPDGCMVILGIWDEATYRFRADGQQAINAIGGEKSLYRAAPYSAYYCIGYKGLAPGYAIDALDPTGGPLRYPLALKY